MVKLTFSMLSSSAAQELTSDVTAEIHYAGIYPRRRVKVLMMKMKKLQRRIWVLEKHINHTIWSEEDVSGQITTGTT